MIGFLALIHPRKNWKNIYTSKVSLIICAFNEQNEIQGKLENTLSLDYPSENLQIIVVSDCSTDGTNDIMNNVLIVLPEHRGKTLVQDIGVSHASGELLAFSDASSMLPPESLRNLVRNFSDPAVGCASCEDKSVKIEKGKRVADEGL